jgi:hypothetical protein
VLPDQRKAPNQPSLAIAGLFYCPEKAMAFTESELQTELAAEGFNCKVIRFEAAGASATDVYAQNVNSTSRKAGCLQIAQSNTAAQAATALKAALSA